MTDSLNNLNLDPSDPSSAVTSATPATLSLLDKNSDQNPGQNPDKNPDKKPVRKPRKISEKSEKSEKINPVQNLKLKLDTQTSEKLLEIQKNRENLLIKINQIQGRLLSGYSKPLDQSLILLLKQDMALISQITDLLSSLRP